MPATSSVSVGSRLHGRACRKLPFDPGVEPLLDVKNDSIGVLDTDDGPGSVGLPADPDEGRSLAGEHGAVRAQLEAWMERTKDLARETVFEKAAEKG